MQQQTYEIAKFLADRYEAEAEKKEKERRQQAGLPDPEDRAGRKRFRAQIRVQALENMARDEQHIGTGLMLAAWEIYKSGDWRFLEGEFDSFGDFMANGVSVFTRRYRRFICQTVEHLFGWVHMPTTKVYLPDTGELITVEMIIDRCAMRRLMKLIPLFGKNATEEDKQKHLLYLVTGIEPGEEEDDTTEDADQAYVTEHTETVRLPKTIVSVNSDGTRNLRLDNVDDEQFSLYQFVMDQYTEIALAQ